jgi:hypothetical protein
MKDKVLIANGQGFWGDSILGPIRLLREGPLDYLTLDYLAEVTMSIMQKLKSRDPSKGYATDFVRLIDRVLPDLVQKGTRVVANAGGVNPRACMEAVLAVCEKHGVSGMKVAIVEGDDVLEDLDDLMAQGETFNNMDTGAPLASVRDRVTSANVYLGAFPIAEALATGAQIVITGRGTDPGLVIGPMIHEFGWGSGDLDELAAGTVAGHIVECGAQCTGGNHTDWRTIPDLAMVGYPIIEVTPSGEFAITKHPGTGGRVDRESVVHQLAYEMGDPGAYLTPDVVADFTSFELEEAGEDRVLVRGVKGSPATPTYKVSMSYQDGWPRPSAAPKSSGNASPTTGSNTRRRSAWSRSSGPTCATQASTSPRRGSRPRSCCAWACGARTAPRSTASAASSSPWSPRGLRASPDSPAAAPRRPRSSATGPPYSPRNASRRGSRSPRVEDAQGQALTHRDGPLGRQG